MTLDNTGISGISKLMKSAFWYLGEFGGGKTSLEYLNFCLSNTEPDVTQVQPQTTILSFSSCGISNSVLEILYGLF